MSGGESASRDGENEVSQRVSEPPDFFDQTWTIRGEVTDKAGEPVEAFDAAAIWSSNGVYWNQDGEILESEASNIWKREGVLAVRPQYAAKLGAVGTFELTIRDRPRAPICVVNPERTQGGIALIDRLASDRPVRIELAPMVQVTVELICPETGKAPRFCKAEIYVVGGDNIYLTQCGTWQGKIAFLLPPGEYELDVSGDFPTAEMRKPKRPDGVPIHGQYARGMRFAVPPASSQVDLGVVELQLAKDAEGNGVDITEFYGKAPPPLDWIDVEGAPKSLSLQDFRGKWVLLEFWALWCSPCIAFGLPELNAFQEQHMDQRDQFQILTICDTAHEEAGTFADLEPRWTDVRRQLWEGEAIPFPVALDQGSRTAEAYGVRARPGAFLIDPEGNLVDTSGIEALPALKKILADLKRQKP